MKRIRNAVGPADLLRLIQEFEPELAAKMAVFAGFTLKTKDTSAYTSSPSQAAQPETLDANFRREEKPDQAFEKFKEDFDIRSPLPVKPRVYDLSHWVVDRRRPLSEPHRPVWQPNLGESVEISLPDGDRELVRDVGRPPFRLRTLHPALLRWLGCPTESRFIDEKRSVALIAAQQALTQVPRRRSLAWPGDVMVVIDGSDHLGPYRAAYWQMARDLTRLIGSQRVTLWWVDTGGGGPFYRYRNRSLCRQRIGEALKGTLVLALSDLGLLRNDGAGLMRWSGMGRWFQRQGARCHVLLPARCLPGRDQRAWHIAYPDLNGRLKILDTKRTVALDDLSEGRDLMLAFMSLALQIDLPLLHALGRLLPEPWRGRGLESRMWQAAEVERAPGWCRLTTKGRGTARALLEEPSFFRRHQVPLRKAAAVINAYNTDADLYIRWEERFIAVSYALLDGPPVAQFFRALTRKMSDASDREAAAFMRRFTQRHLLENSLVGPETEFHRALFASRQLLPLSKADPVPVSSQTFLADWEGHVRQTEETWRLYHLKNRLQLVPASQPLVGSQVTSRPPLTEFDTLQKVLSVGDHPDLLGWRDLSGEGPVFLNKPCGERLVLRNERIELWLKRVEQPPEAEAMWEDLSGRLSLKLHEVYGGRELRWLPPDTQDLPNGKPYHRIQGAWVDAARYAALVGRSFPQPAWATRLGLDRYGVWAELVVGEVTQRMRWIEAGTFSMGSPQREGGEIDELPQHPVWITRPFWLADTACSQALWLALEADNPSTFPGMDLPVEQVSWLAADRFCRKLNQLLATKAFRLPREAEWEYACRAGTATPFASGMQLSTEQANYNGNRPYRDGPPGDTRDKTMPVTAFAPNPWGLYQMHGNVDEWCDDEQRSYTPILAVDPSGARNLGRLRAVRGGCFWNGAWACRSARRQAFTTDDVTHIQGFRFVADTAYLEDG